MKYKESKYNIYIPYNEEYCILYNSFSSAVLLITSDEKKQIEEGIIKQESLIKQGIFIPDTVDELEILDKSRTEYINQNRVVNIRVLTTTGCNARCGYCFEQHISKMNMSLETVNRVAEFIADNYKETEKVKICWFGGEPLVNFEAIKILTSKLKVNSTSKYTFSMVSNGSLLTPMVVDDLKNVCLVKSIQITLDGYGDCYDDAKQYINTERHNFYSVVNNIENTLLQGIYVTIRINYIENNYRSILELIDYLAIRFANNRRLHIYVYPVWNSDENGNYYIKDKQKLLEVLRRLVDRGMSTIDEVVNLKRRNGQCMACNKYSFSILPNGKLIKCTQEMDCYVGDIFSGIVDNNKAAFWTDESLNNSCVECKYLPICQGGCVAGKAGHMRQCFYKKDIFEELLRWYVDKTIDN